MSNQTRNPESKLPLWLKLFVVFVLLVGLVGVFIYTLGVAATNRWERYAAELRAKGEPLTFAEIEAMRTVIPDEENGFRVFEKLLPQLEEAEVTPEDGNVLILGSQALRGELFDGFPRSAIEPSTAFVNRHRDLLDALSQLRDTPVGRIDVDVDEAQADPLSYLAPEVSHLRQASKLVYLDALMKTAGGDTDGAFANAETVAAIAGTLNEAPIVISRLVQIATEAQLSQLVEITLRTGTVPPESIGRIQRVVQRRLASATITWAFRGERASFVAICDSLATRRTSLDPVLGTSINQLPRWLSGWWISGNQTTGAELLSSLVETGDDPIALAAAAGTMDDACARMGATKLLVKMMLPVLSRAVTLHLKIIARLRSTHAALSAERFRIDHDRMPNSLDELLPDYLDAVPIDPFDGKPLRFATTDRGIVIYSIDENLVDDGGSMERRETRPKRPLDVGFRLLNPEHRRVILLDDAPTDGDGEP